MAIGAFGPLCGCSRSGRTLTVVDAQLAIESVAALTTASHDGALAVLRAVAALS